MPKIIPLLLFKSPTTSPICSSGVTTSTFIIGSRITGFALSAPSFKALKEGALKAKPVILEPIMKVEVVTPEEHMGDVVGDLNRRRGIILGMDEIPSGKTVQSEVPLSEMFGYATDLRSQTQGRASFSMEFLKYADVPSSIAEELKTA